MSNKKSFFPFFSLGYFIFLFVSGLSVSELASATWEDQQSIWDIGQLVKRYQREPIISTEFGEVSGVRVTDWNQSYHLQFFTLEPNSLFLPVILHADMVFYVHTGSGILTYQDEDEMVHTRIRRGDVHMLYSGTVFFMQSDLEPERQKLRINAIFGYLEYDLSEPAFGAYSSIRDMVLGFDKKLLQEAFKVPEQAIEEIRSGTKPPAIMHGLPGKKKTMMEMELQLIEDVFGNSIFDFSNKKKSSKLYNIFSEKRDFENCNGWSTTVNKKKYSPLKDSQYSIFMVNLTTGSMMGPHWNPRATEIAVVLQGKGMVRVVCSATTNETECKNSRFGVEEGDVFIVPRFHPMAQMAFNNETFVFMGFSTSTKNNHPQFIAGKASILRTLDKHILATSFGVSDATVDRLLAQQGASVILDCTSCAEEEWRIMQEEIERERQEDQQREEEEARRKEEEKRREEEKKREQEEEEARKREEEKKRQQEEEEARKREEEAEQKRREEEEREREEQKKREEEEREAWEREERKREEQRRREQEEREARQREEEEAQKRREQEEREREQQKQQKQEEREREQQKQREQEQREAQEREEEAARQRREQEEAQKRREQEEAEARKREQEQAEQQEREREAEARREEEAAKRAEEEAQRRGQGGSEGGAGQQGGGGGGGQGGSEGGARQQGGGGGGGQGGSEGGAGQQGGGGGGQGGSEGGAGQQGGGGGGGQGGSEGGAGQQGGGSGGGQPAQEKRAAAEEEAAKQEEETAQRRREEGEQQEAGKGWGRRILKKTA